MHLRGQEMAPYRQRSPQVATDLSGTHTAQATLLNTTEGWEVAERPLRATDGQRASTLAKMKAVFAPGS